MLAVTLWIQTAHIHKERIETSINGQEYQSEIQILSSLEYMVSQGLSL